MSIVNGQLQDVNAQVMANKLPLLIFTPQEPATAGTVVYPTESIEVAPAFATGNFSVDLVDSSTTGVLYDLAIQWQARPPTPGDSGFIRKDFFKGLFIPSGGGSIADLIRKSPGRWLVWIGPTPPNNPKPGALWLNSETGTLSEWS